MFAFDINKCKWTFFQDACERVGFYAFEVTVMLYPVG